MWQQQAETGNEAHTQNAHLMDQGKWKLLRAREINKEKPSQDRQLEKRSGSGGVIGKAGKYLRSIENAVRAVVVPAKLWAVKALSEAELTVC